MHVHRLVVLGIHGCLCRDTTAQAVSRHLVPVSVLVLGTVWQHRASVSPSPMACLLRGYGRADTQNDRLCDTRAIDMPSEMEPISAVSGHLVPVSVLVANHPVHDRLRRVAALRCLAREALRVIEQLVDLPPDFFLNSHAHGRTNAYMPQIFG